ncbi:MAG: aminopeptidase P family protein [Trueperaceae bacterium]|nr:aminopeptidase P family protein [Trueperaceae bacterium]
MSEQGVGYYELEHGGKSMIRQKQEEVQAFLKEQGWDGWLIYDFRGTNPFATKVFNHGATILSRRWFIWIPAQGDIKILVHDIEFGSFPRLGFEVFKYNGRESLGLELSKLLGGANRIAMEYSPMANNPYVSKVDGGTLELIRSLGVEVVSSGDLLQLFLAWTPEQLDNHLKAAAVLTETKDKAIAYIRQHISEGTPLNEYQLQQYMNDFIESQGMDPGHAPIIGFGPGGGDPHYVPAKTGSKVLEPGDAILMDLFCKAPGDNPFADITWMAHYDTPTERFMKVFNAVLKSRDTAVELLQNRLSQGKLVRGYEVDLTTRKVLIDAGYEANLKHRTGHSLGNVTTHGEAAHFDGFETLDERAVLPGIGITIEPGVYFDDFGVRSEINVYAKADGVDITTALQTVIDIV